MVDSTAKTRTAFGYDAHRFGGSDPVMLAGVAVHYSNGVEATSDGDVPAHALADAVLGIAALGDIGQHFPASNPASQNADSMDMLERCAVLVRNAGWAVTHCDVTVVAEDVRVAPHRAAMRINIARALQIDVEAVSVKATSTDGMGWIGAGEGIAAYAVATGLLIE